MALEAQILGNRLGHEEIGMRELLNIILSVPKCWFLGFILYYQNLYLMDDSIRKDIDFKP